MVVLRFDSCSAVKLPEPHMNTGWWCLVICNASNKWNILARNHPSPFWAMCRQQLCLIRSQHHTGAKPLLLQETHEPESSGHGNGPQINLKPTNKDTNFKSLVMAHRRVVNQEKTTLFFLNENARPLMSDGVDAVAAVACKALPKCHSGSGRRDSRSWWTCVPPPCGWQGMGFRRLSFVPTRSICCVPWNAQSTHHFEIRSNLWPSLTIQRLESRSDMLARTFHMSDFLRL